MPSLPIQELISMPRLFNIIPIYMFGWDTCKLVELLILNQLWRGNCVQPVCSNNFNVVSNTFEPLGEQKHGWKAHDVITVDFNGTWRAECPGSDKALSVLSISSVLINSDECRLLSWPQRPSWSSDFLCSDASHLLALQKNWLGDKIMSQSCLKLLNAAVEDCQEVFSVIINISGASLSKQLVSSRMARFEGK